MKLSLMKAHVDVCFTKPLFLFPLQLKLLLKLKLRLLGPIIGVSLLMPKILGRDCCIKPPILIYKAGVIADFVFVCAI